MQDTFSPAFNGNGVSDQVEIDIDGSGKIDEGEFLECFHRAADIGRVRDKTVLCPPEPQQSWEAGAGAKHLEDSARLLRRRRRRLIDAMI